MHQTWKTNTGEVRRGEIDESLGLFIGLIGVDATAKLVISCGGTNVCCGTKRTAGMVSDIIGEDLALKLSEEFFGGNFRVPVNKKFVARHLRGNGHTVQGIARELHCDRTTVQRYLAGDKLAHGQRKSP